MITTRPGACIGTTAAADRLRRGLCLAWPAHISWDRGLGFGFRTREGYQRVPVCR